MKTAKFIKEVKKINFINIRHYLEKNGWKVILFNTNSGDGIIKKLKLEKFTGKSDGFVYDVGLLKYVFINGRLSERDKLIVLLHETGHIVLGQDLSAIDKIDELNAWNFTYDVYSFKKHLSKKIVSFLMCIVIFMISSTMFNDGEPR